MAKIKVNRKANRILKTYLALTLLSTFASSFIWGINTLFLLDADLSITQAFAANAFFTAGQVLFEVPTGIAADTLGRRASYLLGSATLFVATILYLLLWQTHGPFWAWAVISMLLGLGFTFFSGATEAWLVDGMNAAKYKGTLETVLAKGAIASGVAMLTGTVAGGVIAQFSNLGVPYILRAAMLLLTFIIAFAFMRDEGFSPRKSASLLRETRSVLKASLKYGIRNPPVRWLMLSAPFAGGVSMFAFYAMQPYLLELYGGPESYAIAGIAAAIVAGAQIIGGLLVPFAGKLFHRRTTLLLVGSALSAVVLGLMGFVAIFWVVLILLSMWSIVFAATGPIRQAFINGLIPSEQRATVLSSDNLLSSFGGVVFQPGLGKVAEAWGYPASYVASAAIQFMALPFILFAMRAKAPSDAIKPQTKTGATLKTVSGKQK
ncbi:MAG TPA: MFS transporter [Pyrinomonadaceae bacterium]|nr:MFS transporter [Pyrinomonadaceae bacterium]